MSIPAPPSEGRRQLAGRGELATVAAAGTIGLLVVAGWLLAGLDRPGYEDLSDIRAGWLTALVRLVTQLGSPVAMVALAAAATVVLWRRSGLWLVALVPVAVAAASTATELALKAIVGRSRPPASAMLVAENGYGFPSGHATVSTGLLVCLALMAPALVTTGRVWVLRVGVFVAVAAIGLSRLYLGVHWPSDVFAGWSIGALLAAIVVFAADHLARANGPATTGNGGRSTSKGSVVRHPGRDLSPPVGAETDEFTAPVGSCVPPANGPVRHPAGRPRHQ